MHDAYSNQGALLTWSALYSDTRRRDATTAVPGNPDADRPTLGASRTHGEFGLILPGVALALRFGNEDGFVQQFFAKQRDLVARELRGRARCLLVFKKLENNPVYSPGWAIEAKADFYDFSPENRERIEQFIRENHIVLVIFQSAELSEIDLKIPP